MIEVEEQLRAHLEHRAAGAVPVSRLDSVVAVERDVPTSARPTHRSRWLLGAVAALVVIMVGGLVAVRRGGDTSSSGSGKPPALPDGVPETGAEWTQVGHLTLEAATATLLHECMVRAGYDYQPGVDDLGVAMGAWQPHPVLGIFTEAAAARYGYRMAHAESGAERFAATLDEAEREAFYAAAMGPPNEPSLPVTLPDGSPSGMTISRGGCMGETDAAFDDALVQQEGLRAYVFETGIDQEAVSNSATADPRVADALRQWASCVEEATGEQAATPNELARQFALSGGEVTQREIDVAVADARCQTTTGLQDTWYRVVAEYQRAALDEHPEWFDQLATMRVGIVAKAQEILDDREINVTGVPSRD